MSVDMSGQLKRCANCARPRDNGHPTLCAVCEHEALNAAPEAIRADA